MKTKCIKLAEVVTTAGTQIRAKIDTDTVDQYAEAMLDSTNKFPSVVVFHDGSQYILADGFHRVMAASRNGFIDIEADVRKGTRSDALKYALGANATHGLKRSNSDKRRSVELALTEWPKLSDREIARICAVSNNFVSEQRKQLSSDDSSEPATRIGADGKERKLPKRKPQPETEAEPAPEPAEPPRVHTADEIQAEQEGENTPFEVNDETEQRSMEEEFRSTVEANFHRWMRQWSAEELPAVRRIIRPLVARD